MNLDAAIGKVLPDRRVFIALILITILVSIYFRIGLLQYPGFFEPDVFFYYAYVRAILNSNLIEPAVLNISGFPAHNGMGEAPGLPYTVVAPYLVLKYLGISYYDIMRNIAVVFALLDMLGTYFLARYLSNSRWLGLMSALFVALSNGNTARTSATVFRGDTFITIVIIAALVLMLRALSDENTRKQVLFSLASGFALSIGIVFWNGAPFVTAVYFVAVFVLLAYSFVADQERLLRKTIIAAVCGLLFSAMLQDIYVGIGIARPGLQLTGTGFFLIFIPLIAAAVAAFYILKMRHRIPYVRMPLGRLGIAAVAALLVFAVIYLSDYGFISGLNAAVTGTNAIGITTQELQRPDLTFLYYSSGLQLYLFPIGVMLFILLSHELGNEHHARIGRIRIGASAGFLVILSYLIVTGYLQYSAIRYNSIVSIPIAIFAAYAVYAAARLCLRFAKVNNLIFILVLTALVIGAYAYGIATFQYPDMIGNTAAFLIAAGWLSVAMMVLTILYFAYAILLKSLDMRIFFISLFIVFFLYSSEISWLNAYTSTQANGMNPLFYSAMAWFGQNSAPNSTVLSVWTDGSVVEGIANRTSYVDSVGGENGAKILGESRFLFSTNNDTQYLYSIGKPDYIISRSYWYEELGGLATEGNITNRTYYFLLMTAVNETGNSTAQLYFFHSATEPYSALLEVQPQANGTDKFAAFIGTVSSSRLYEIRQVVFYNVLNYSYAIVNSSNPNVYNNTLMVSYAINPQTGSRVITGGVILGQGLAESNIFKLTYLCNEQHCAFGDRNVTAHVVYLNNDTRIVHLTYV
ncbi:MAG: hypothetical protein KGH72_01385 [Candidatus Micrarchaeota archaeon]|nr:hypothetical protein [Candidatus Micrarchaeota archaeon]